MLFMRGYFNQGPELSVLGLSDLVFFATSSKKKLHSSISFSLSAGLSQLAIASCVAACAIIAKALSLINITPFQSEISTGGTFYNIPAAENFSKSVQKKFAFAENGGIVSDKGLETLAHSGCNADTVGVTPVQSFSKSILGLSSGIFASTAMCVFPARQALFVCVWKRKQKETFNCLTHRRAERCNKTCKANSQSRNSARTLNAHSELSTTPEKKIHFCRHAAQTLLSLKFSRCGSMTESPKSKRLGWTDGQKQFEWQHQQPADRIAENNRIYQFLAFAGRPDRGFYRPCKMTNSLPCALKNATLTLYHAHYGVTTTGELFQHGVSKYYA